MTAPLAASRSTAPLRPLVARLLRFATVGASGVAINTGVFWLFTASLHLHYLVAGAAAIEAATISNYLLNNAWTFADRHAGGGLRGPGRYHLVTLGGLGISLLVLHLLAADFGLPPPLANLCGIAAATAWNFSLNLCWTWREAAA